MNNRQTDIDTYGWSNREKDGSGRTERKRHRRMDGRGKRNLIKKALDSRAFENLNSHLRKFRFTPDDDIKFK